MQQKRNWAPWISGAIIIAVALLITLSVLSGPAGRQQPGPAPVYATQGSIVDGFPKYLILDRNILVNSSYVVNYSSSTRQYTAQWVSPRAASEVFNAYLYYFNQYHWQVTNRQTQKTFLGLYAENTTSSVNVVVTPAGQMSQVQVGFAVK